eukprot:jgi/Botrbrau1/19660/Bobra.0003s0024.1
MEEAPQLLPFASVAVEHAFLKTYHTSRSSIDVIVALVGAVVAAKDWRTPKVGVVVALVACLQSPVLLTYLSPNYGSWRPYMIAPLRLIVFAMTDYVLQLQCSGVMAPSFLSAAYQTTVGCARWRIALALLFLWQMPIAGGVITAHTFMVSYFLKEVGRDCKAMLEENTDLLKFRWELRAFLQMSREEGPSQACSFLCQDRLGQSRSSGMCFRQCTIIAPPISSLCGIPGLHLCWVYNFASLVIAGYLLPIAGLAAWEIWQRYNFAKREGFPLKGFRHSLQQPLQAVLKEVLLNCSVAASLLLAF